MKCWRGKKRYNRKEEVREKIKKVEGEGEKESKKIKKHGERKER